MAWFAIQYLVPLVPMYFLTRLLFWLFRGMSPSVTKVIVIHGVALLLAFFLAGLGASNGGPFVWTAGLRYVPAGLLILAIDFFAYLRRPPEEVPKRLVL